jgi:threonine synthase
VFACYAASKMGMPLSKIIVAVNSNDILHRFFKDNDYSKDKVSETISPSMDISVASNFERLIYDFYLNRDSDKCSNLYSKFPTESIRLDEDIWKKSASLFLSYSIDDKSTFKCMKTYFENSGYIMDPHTAVAADAVSKLNDKLENKIIILATAHPAKFPNALKKADINLTNIPKNLQKVLNKKEISFKLSPFDNSIFEFIKDNN